MPYHTGHKKTKDKMGNKKKKKKIKKGKK